MKEVEGGKGKGERCGKILVKKSGWFESKADFCSTLFIQNLLISQNSLIAIVYLENVQIGVAQHQPAAVHFFVGAAQVARAADEQESFSELAEWLRARGAYINKARCRGLLPDGWDVFLKPYVGMVMF